jgi:flagella basal body P-ring formation protein FlgA
MPRVWLRASASCAILLLALILPNTAAGQHQDLAEVQRTAEAFAQSHVQAPTGRVEIAASPLDPRSKLARCDSLQAFLAPGAKLWGSSNVGVRCLRPESWSVFVPVAVRVFADVVVTSRPISRGQTLAEGDLTLQNADLTQLPGRVFTDPQQVIGRAANAAFPAGFVLRSDTLRAPHAVFSGQMVRIVFQGEGFKLSSEGRALANAGVGEPVQVRTSAGRVLKGVVQSPGVVEVR